MILKNALPFLLFYEVTSKAEIKINLKLSIIVGVTLKSVVDWS